MIAYTTDNGTIIKQEEKLEYYEALDKAHQLETILILLK